MRRRNRITRDRRQDSGDASAYKGAHTSEPRPAERRPDLPITGARGQRHVFDRWPAAVYAVGDVHGCHGRLVDLERAIAADAAAIEGEKWLVTLGDYIDRGSESAAVIEHLLAPPPTGFRRFCLRGNHEQMMLDFFRDPARYAYWLGEGGIRTIASYGIEVPAGIATDRFLAALAERIEARIPDRHLSFIDTLPMLLSLPGWVFVHAGLRPGVGLEQQDDSDLVWIREAFLDGPGLPGVRVVHGHTPTREPVVTPVRIGIDTHCFSTGRLTALRVMPDGTTKLLSTG